MKYLFFWEDEGVQGENAFTIEAMNLDDAYEKAFDQYGPQINEMFCSPISPEPPLQRKRREQPPEATD